MSTRGAVGSTSSITTFKTSLSAFATSTTSERSASNRSGSFTSGRRRTESWRRSIPTSWRTSNGSDTYGQPGSCSRPQLSRAGAILDRNDAQGQRLLRAATEERVLRPNAEPEPIIADFRSFAETALDWDFASKGYAGTADTPIPPELEVVLPEYGETLRPDYAVRELEPLAGRPAWQLLVCVLGAGVDLDTALQDGHGLEASPHSRMERLLRDTDVSAGLLCNGSTLRLISAPRGESSGWLDFHVADMTQTAGRPISTALRLLLGQQRLLALPRAERLTALLDDSRSFQNEVSERLAEQVLHALYELLRGFQAAHDASKGELLRDELRDDPDEVYRSLLTVILRLVFLLYSEERAMLPGNDVFTQHYSLAGLYTRLREDAALFPDTMDQRFGAWAQLLVLFRLIHDGAEAGALHLPRRHGVLFDPDRFPFLEGRHGSGARQIFERIEPPLVPDGTIFRALEDLLVLDGERISYRALDVEQIGSVYETMMGFRLEIATGRSIAIRPQKRHGAPTTIDLDRLLGEPSAKREKWFRDRADRKIGDKIKQVVKSASSIEELHAALDAVADRAASPDLVPPGAMVLQPSEERRRSGSHYTPRSLTEPIVRITLEPILDRLRIEADGRIRPDQILDLKVCDPAMGSGAFLVEACRQLGDALVRAWQDHDAEPTIPPDEDAIVFARRLVAQRCLYGVDRNPVAVDLAKVSLWLVTLAREHALTFVDHALRHGDSLVGLSTRQLESFHWSGDAQTFEAGLETMQIRDHVSTINDLRGQIRDADETIADWELDGLWRDTQHELDKVRLYGDLVVAAYFDGPKPKSRESQRVAYARAVLDGSAEELRGWLDGRRHDVPPLAPFHWPIEFPEVFERVPSGFDAIVGNPPFGGKNTISAGNVDRYTEWLKDLHAGTHGNADVVAHFYRRAFNLIRPGGTFGLIATNTIAQGDTRSSGLRWICTNGGEIYSARRRLKWPGLAAVVVSVVHVMKGDYVSARFLDGREVEVITAFLFHRGGNDDPARLSANTGKSFVGSYVLGMGFTFDDSDTKGVASSIAEMQRLIEENPRNAEVIFPYIGGNEVNTSPTQEPHRYVINFGERPLEECRRNWPRLLEIVEQRVRPDREHQASIVNPARWWMFARPAAGLADAARGLERVIVISQTSRTGAFCLLPAGAVFSHKLIVFPFDNHAALGSLQSRVHEVWARTFGSTMKDDPVYAPSDCFETFPFPDRWHERADIGSVGALLDEFRSGLMLVESDGLTTTYNRFHDPEERDPSILRLRELHEAVDREVLDAYGWHDVPTGCVFLLDFEDDEAVGVRRKPWRYRWPDEVRDEVLARLLELNALRAADETRLGASAAHASAPRRTKAKTTNTEAML